MVPIYYAKEVEQVFDAISYNKGSTIVRMAQSVLGTVKFREGLQLYCKRHAYGNTETVDLWQAWSDVSGIDMFSMMQSWTQQMGYPFVAVESEEWSGSGVRLQLRQQWFLNDGVELSSEETDKCWSIPLLVSSSEDATREGDEKTDGGVMSESCIARTATFDRVVDIASGNGEEDAR